MAQAAAAGSWLQVEVLTASANNRCIWIARLPPTVAGPDGVTKRSASSVLVAPEEASSPEAAISLGASAGSGGDQASSRASAITSGALRCAADSRFQTRPGPSSPADSGRPA